MHLLSPSMAFSYLSADLFIPSRQKCSGLVFENLPNQVSTTYWRGVWKICRVRKNLASSSCKTGFTIFALYKLL